MLEVNLSMSSNTVVNFGAGPAKLPREVLLEAQRDLLNYASTGLSIVEMSHRSEEYTLLNNRIQQDLRDILEIPSNYKILFLQGGGTALFAAVAMNLMKPGGSADYFVTGSWSKKAAKEATKYGSVNYVLPEESTVNIPDQSSWKLDSGASYVYYCDNETIHGVEFPFIPDTKGVPLVCDMSSNFLTRKFDVSQFGLIFAGAQKNIGPPGVTVVIVREDLLGKASPITPLVMDFTINANDNSVHNTPPMFSIYVVGLVLQWISRQGGVAEMEQLAHQKSQRLYDFIDLSGGFYSVPVSVSVRSRMNVPFRINGGDEKLEKLFLDGAKKLGLLQLKGHRMVGGIRASLYNAITLEETDLLVNYMKKFHLENAAL